MKQPIPHCYWVSPGQLLAGEYPRDLDEQASLIKLNALTQAGVSVFIDLTEEKDGLLSYQEMIFEARYLRFPIRDVSVPVSPELMLKILDTIDLHINESKVVYVHCWGGIGRTGTVVGCWLARHGHEAQAAYVWLQELWQNNSKSAYRKSPETLEQKQYILDWRE